MDLHRQYLPSPSPGKDGPLTAYLTTILAAKSNLAAAVMHRQKSRRRADGYNGGRYRDGVQGSSMETTLDSATEARTVGAALVSHAVAATETMVTGAADLIRPLHPKTIPITALQRYPLTPHPMSRQAHKCRLLRGRVRFTSKSHMDSHLAKERHLQQAHDRA
ncbi:hypothetical protein CONLIGDRAFT_686754 [Coniochaeta ligniaria NRRL 30616]|uniref:Uncharacterized protein n=1 Tax=Coniochaeta ligniaria NRRL 30616 TaxID=1408157 RepID=A0A1J7I7H3_9PEZI|nr:hypothetical protein CONLIGDRAFT_686754 [Coniochaeta ligniaria NRRL 30616]